MERKKWDVNDKAILMLFCSLILLLVAGCNRHDHDGSNDNDDKLSEPPNTINTMVLRNLTNYDIDVTVEDVDPGIWPTDNNPGQLAGHYPSGSLRMHQIDIGEVSKSDLIATFTFSWMDHGSHLNDVWRWRGDSVRSSGVYLQDMDLSAGKVLVMAWYDANYINATLLPADIPFSDWMSKLPGSTRLSSLSIPGTHDSGTFNLVSQITVDLFWVITQFESFTDTLEDEGVRAFDIRLAPYSDSELRIVHSSYDTGLKFAENFLTDCRNFLAQHPKEVLIARIQRDYGDVAVVKNVLNDILNHPDWNDLIYLPTSTTEYPRLYEVYGKLVLIYDDNIYDERALGYRLYYTDDTSLSVWQDPAAPDLKWLIHDNYNATDQDMKKRHVSAFWDYLLSSYQQEDVMSLLFLNASRWNHCPFVFAEEVNPWFTKKIADLGKNDRLGVVFSDFIDRDMSYILIAQNYRKYNINL